MVNTHKLAEMELLMERVQKFIKEIEWEGGPFRAVQGCLSCKKHPVEDHEDSCIVKEVLSYE